MMRLLGSVGRGGTGRKETLPPFEREVSWDYVTQTSIL